MIILEDAGFISTYISKRMERKFVDAVQTLISANPIAYVHAEHVYDGIGTVKLYSPLVAEVPADLIKGAASDIPFARWYSKLRQ
jgi:hypothetical protein